MSQHQFVHVEISCQDRQAAAEFYSNVFGWQFTDYPEMNYSSTTNEDVTTGLNPVNEQTPAGTVTVYIGTPDYKASSDAIVSNGGELLGDPVQVPGVGTLQFFKDPTGNVLSLLQSAENPGM